MDCYGCGHQLTEADLFCPMCGRGRRAPGPPAGATPEMPRAQAEPAREVVAPAQEATLAATILPAPAIHPRDAQTDVESPADTTGLQHASFGRRSAGFGVDFLINAAASFALTIGLYELLLPQNYTQSKLDSVRWSVFVIVTAVFVLYRWFADSLGGTLGKRIVGVRIVLEGTDDDAGFGPGIVRVVVAIPSALALGLGYFSAAWDAKGQTWHDKAAGTVAVRSTAPLRGLVPALVLGAAVLATIATVSYRDLRNRNDTTSPANVEQASASFRSGYIGACRVGSDWRAAGVTDPARIDGICGCVADVILGHYTLSQITADAARLTKNDPAGYSRFLREGPYGQEVLACMRA